jgi:nucleoside-diphosphate-sugar epimerase
VRILVTGAAGHLGRQVVPALLADPRVTSVVATDRVAIAVSHPKLTTVTRDLVSGGFTDLLDGVDGLIHLAFHVDRRPGQDIAALNDAATRALVDAAAHQTDVIVVASSIAAYGLRDTDFDRLVESDPIAPSRGFYYADQKMALERHLAGLAGTARARLVIARPVSVAGPTIDPRRALQYKDKHLILPRVRHALRFQALHEADVGSAFLALLDAPSGVYNVAPDDWLAMDEVVRITGQTLVYAPRWVCWALCQATWRLGLNSLDAEWLLMNDYPTLIGDNSRLRALGWRPTRTSADALADTVAAIRGHRQEALV